MFVVPLDLHGVHIQLTYPILKYILEYCYLYTRCLKIFLVMFQEVDAATVERVGVENRLTTAQEEIEFLKRVYDEVNIMSV